MKLLIPVVVVLLLAQASCAVGVARLAFWMWPTAKRVDAASAALLVCRYQDAAGKWHGNPNCVQSLAQSIGGSVRTSAGAIAKAAPEIAESAKHVAAASARTSEETVKLTQKATDTVDNVNGLVTELRNNLDELNTDVADLLDAATTMVESANEPVKEAGKSLQALTELENELRKELAEGSPKAMETLAAIDKLVSDPALDDVLKQIDASSKSGAEILKTVDLSTRGLREKAGRVKWVIEKIIGLVKVTIPLF